MTTPTKEQIREWATEMFDNSNRHILSISPEDSELKENGLWFEARNKLMRDTARIQQLSYVEEMANELGFELMKQKPSRLAKQTKSDTLELNIEQAMRSGIFVLRTSDSGKTNSCFHFAGKTNAT